MYNGYEIVTFTMSWKKQTRLIALITGIALFLPVGVWAQTSTSPSYRVEEAQFGSGGEVESCSGNQFCAQTSLGSLGVGSASSTNFDVQAGFLTESEPFLEMIVSSTPVDLGLLDPGTTATGSSTFVVRTYVSEAYTVVTMSDPPTNGGEQLDPMATPSAPTPGTEQFGINVVFNDELCGVNCDVGANPVNQPNNNFADGEAASGYDSDGMFKYSVGDVIAQSAATVGNQAVGLTEYTISYIANISPITAGGTYLMEHILVAVPTF